MIRDERTGGTNGQTPSVRLWERAGRQLLHLRRRFASPAAAAGFGAAVMAAAFLLRLAIDDPAPRFVTLYPAVALAALIGGPVSGVVATLSSAAMVDYFFLPPVGKLVIGDPSDLISLLNFVATGLIVSLVAATDRLTSDRMATETRRLGAEDLRHRTIVDALHAGVVQLTPDGRIVTCNPSAERLLRTPRAELLASRDGLARWRALYPDGSPMPVEQLPPSRALRTGASYHLEVVGLQFDDEVVWLLVNADPVYDPRGAEIGSVVVSFVDISGRLRAERDLAESRAHLHSVFAALHEAVLVFSADRRVQSCNPAAERILGRSAAELIADGEPDDWKIIDETGEPVARADIPIERVLHDGRSIHGQIIGLKAGDRIIWLENNAEPLRDPLSGAITGVVVSFTDITERRRLQRDLAESRERFASIVTSAMDAIVTVDARQRIVLFNAAAERMFGRRADEVLGQPIDMFVPERLRERHTLGFRAFAEGRDSGREMGPGMALTALRSDGSEFPIEASISRTRSGDDAQFTIIHRDISARQEAERTNARLATLVHSSPDAILTVSLGGRILTWNDAATRMFGYNVSEVIGAPIDILQVAGAEDDGHGLASRVRQGESIKIETLRRHADGHAIEVLLSVAPIRDSSGRVIAVAGIIADIGERKQAERELSERQLEQRQTLDAAGLGVWWIDLADRSVHCDPRSRALFDLPEVAPVEALVDRLHPDDRAVFTALLDTEPEKPAGRPAVRRTAAGGHISWLSLTARRRTTAGGVGEVWGTVQDVTEQRAAEQALKRFEASRRLEALGRMTGGIAHDFNNLLTVISGNLQLLDLSPGDAAASRWINEALRATETGAALNQRLTTFAGRRRLEPAVTILNERIELMIDLLRRTVGPEISVAAIFSEHPGAVKVDPMEIENAVLNLVFNARDAMPHGGRILIETRNVEIDAADLPAESDLHGGAYVRLSVSDTGHGMAPEVQARAFEPFFTTKETGRGTGLGLATLHGFVRQSKGFVTLYSELGLGTTVAIHLPRVDGAAVGTTPAVAPLRGSGQTILVVEDNADVGRVTCERLVAIGYRVVQAAGAAAAFDTLADHPEIALVFTDIVMPGGISGIDLARRLRAEGPRLPIVLTSGFAEEAFSGPSAATIEFPLLRKPYSLGDLGAVIAAALGDGGGIRSE